MWELIMSEMIAAIAAHRAVWQAFQDAPTQLSEEARWKHLDAEYEAEQALLSAMPQDSADLAALKDYLDWWVVEEAQRRENEPGPFVMHRVIELAMGQHHSLAAGTAPVPITHDDGNGMIMGGGDD
jgi:hypothetical protein